MGSKHRSNRGRAHVSRAKWQSDESYWITHFKVVAVVNQTAYPAGRLSSGSSGSQMAFTIIEMMDESVSLRCALSRESASTQHPLATPLYAYV
eukprot:scaffold333787_cov17-Prasinocladus_malaysianus.AAC.1